MRKFSEFAKNIIFFELLFLTHWWTSSISPKWTSLKPFAFFYPSLDCPEKPRKLTESYQALQMGKLFLTYFSNFFPNYFLNYFTNYFKILYKECFRYTKCNPNIFQNADSCYVVGFSIILLNTTLHNPNVKSDQRQTEERFIELNEAIEGQSIPRETLSGYYRTPVSKFFDSKMFGQFLWTLHVLLENKYQKLVFSNLFVFTLVSQVNKNEAIRASRRWWSSFW